MAYYDSYKFTPFLKDASGGTSIIYRYDENYTPLASVGSSYHTIEDISYIRFHNQIMGISGDTITHAIGKKDVSLNIYTSTGEYTEDISTVDISGIPFIGYYSSENIQGTSDVKVFDLFQYDPSTYYTFTPKDPANTTYTEAVKTSDTEYDDFNLFVKFTYQDDSIWEASNFGTHIGLYSNPTANSYNRIESYKYPTINVNNVVTSRGTDYNNPKNITTELVLPTLS